MLEKRINNQLIITENELLELLTDDVLNKLEKENFDTVEMYVERNFATKKLNVVILESRVWEEMLGIYEKAVLYCSTCVCYPYNFKKALINLNSGQDKQKIIKDLVELETENRKNNPVKLDNIDKQLIKELFQVA